MSNGPHYDRVRSTITRLAPIWESRMGLTHFEINHVFLESQFGEMTEDDFLVTAVCETRWNYLQATIKWYLPSAVRHTDEELEGTLVHELCHVLLAPEQALLEVKLDQARADLGGDDFDQVQALMYERMEMATEYASRAIMKAWQKNPANILGEKNDAS